MQGIDDIDCVCQNKIIFAGVIKMVMHHLSMNAEKMRNFNAIIVTKCNFSAKIEVKNPKKYVLLCIFDKNLFLDYESPK